MMNGNQQIIVSRVLVGGFLGAILSGISWAVIWFFGMHSVMNALQTNASSPNTFLLDVVYAPIRYLIIFAGIGTTLGANTGALLGAKAIKSREGLTQVGQPSSTDSWPPSPTPPAV